MQGPRAAACLPLIGTQCCFKAVQDAGVMWDSPNPNPVPFFRWAHTCLQVLGFITLSLCYSLSLPMVVLTIMLQRALRKIEFLVLCFILVVLTSTNLQGQAATSGVPGTLSLWLWACRGGRAVSCCAHAAPGVHWAGGHSVLSQVENCECFMSSFYS